MTEYRVEKDSLGEVRVPLDALYGAQTQRACENFLISGIRFPRVFIEVLGLIKGAAAEVNSELGLLETEKARAIKGAADEVTEGKWDEHFPIDIFQTGSGTSTNMNANEVIARRANQILGKESGTDPVHPNDHVNMCQSSNDVIPTAIHVSAYIQVEKSQCDDIVKTGRTHLMDALPIRLDQEIGGWAHQVRQSVDRIRSSLLRLAQLALGGTAVGTGVNAHPDFASGVISRVSKHAGVPFRETDNHFASQASVDTAVELSGNLKTTATALIKICNDLRWMNSGPIAGLKEIHLPSLQPGSSIMPGKVNPVICESLMMACAQVIGNDTAISAGNAQGNFQLNVMLPLIAHNLLQSIEILGNAVRLLAEMSIAGFTVNKESMLEFIERNPILVTVLNPVIGYDRAAQIAKKAYAEGRRIKEVVQEMTDLSPEEIDRLIDPIRMTEGGIEK
jgi:fumarate hydratase class II